MSRCIRGPFALAALVMGMGACSSTSNGGGGAGNDGGQAPGTLESVRQAVLDVIHADPRLAAAKPLAPVDYGAIAQTLAAVPGVQADDYVGDTLGTIYIKVQGGGLLVYRHIKDDLGVELASLPPQADFTNMPDPTYNHGWQAAATGPDSIPIRPVMADPVTNTYATHFPVASANPDPTFASDGPATCPQEGKIAIVDFLWSAAHKDTPGLYEAQFDVDGVMLYDRITRIAAAGNFTVDVYKDTDINLGTFTRLADYSIVYTVGHGIRPGPKTTAKLGVAASVLLLTAETYDASKTTASGMTYPDAWGRGYFAVDVDSKLVMWAPSLVKDFYKPTVPQLVMLNECWALLPFSDIGYAYDAGNQQWTWTQGAQIPLYNFGHAFRDAGAKVVFGYKDPATPDAVVQNTMPFFRRMFGGYSSKDLPPSPFHFWPTCMGTQTYFRLPATPSVATYADKNRGGSVYTMFADSENLLLRKECPGTVPHAMMQDFMLTVGTPATAFQKCWDDWWSSGTDPSGLQDVLCSQGDSPTTLELTHDAACAVKIARQATNAILSP